MPKPESSRSPLVVSFFGVSAPALISAPFDLKRMAVGLAFAASVLAASHQPARARGAKGAVEESLTPQIGWDNHRKDSSNNPKGR